MDETQLTVSNEALIERVKQLEESLSLLEAERQKQTNLEYEWSGNLGRWQWDLAANHVSFNPLKATALGYDPNEIEGQIGFEFFTEKLHPEDYERVMDNMRSHLSGKSNAYEVEYRIQCKSGEFKWYYDRGIVTKRDKAGQPLLVAGIVFDITKNKVLEEFLKETNKELALAIASKNRLFSIVAHDLRGPIGSTAAIMAELIDGRMEQFAIQETLTILKDSADQTYSLLENLLSWSSIQSGSYKHQPSRLSLALLLEKTVKLLEPQLLHKNIKLKIELKPGLELWADELMTATLVRNLLSNAIKFSHKDSVIEITAFEQAEQVSVSIQDFGLGMSQAQIEKLFSLSESVHTSGTEGEVGSGLGLILCKDILEKNAGQLKVTSQVGKGSRFLFLLPRPKVDQV